MRDLTYQESERGTCWRRANGGGLGQPGNEGPRAFGIVLVAIEDEARVFLVYEGLQLLKV